MTRYNGPIANLTAEEQVNTILFRLAEAMDYRVNDGVIVSDIDAVLDDAVRYLQCNYGFD